MYSYQSTSQQHYSPPPPAEQQYAQPSYGQPVNHGSYAGASQYASTSGSSSGYAGQQSPPYGEQQQQPTPMYGAEVPYGGYGQPAPAHSPAPMYGSTSHAEYGAPAASPPPSYHQYQQHPQQHYQSSHYSSPAPPPASYTQPPPQQPAPGPSLPYNIGSDQNVFRGYFSHELRQLTFNSKPIINALTILAHEHATRMAPIVCQCLEEHIRQVRAEFFCFFSILSLFHSHDETEAIALRGSCGRRELESTSCITWNLPVASRRKFGRLRASLNVYQFDEG